MRAGRLNKRVIIQTRTTTDDEAGQPVISWSNLVAGDGKVWADVRDQSGREYMESGAVQSAVITKITIRKRSGLKAEMRILHGDAVYSIDAVIEQRDSLLLMCRRNG